MPLAAPNYCPCGSMAAASQCCSRLIYQGQTAATAVELMRSRYSAHVCGAIEYLWETWSESTRHRTSVAAIREWATGCEWRGLEILGWREGGPGDDQGTVTFSATYRMGQQTHRHLEKSQFCRENGFWRYFDHCV